MSQGRLWIVAAILGTIIIVGFLISVPHTTRDVVPEEKAENPFIVPPVTYRDMYKKGRHTITGSVTAPTACAVVTAEATLVEETSSAERIALALSLVTDTGVCLELPTPFSFSATLTAPASLPIVVTVNGAVASTTTL